MGYGATPEYVAGSFGAKPLLIMLAEKAKLLTSQLLL
jgi:hypothetical protein